MSDLSVNTNNLQDEGLDAETVDLGTSNLETTPSVDLGTSSIQVGIGGPEGVGIQSIEQTTTSTEDGGINEVTQTLTDGTTAVFQIRNGQRGSQGERGEKGDAGEDWIPTQQELASIASSAAALVDVPTKVSDLQNDRGYYSKPSGGIPKTDLASSVQTSLGKADTALQSFTESDPTVPAWAKQSTKPTYTASEVGALPASTTIPSALADLSADSTHRTVTDAEKATWNAYPSVVSTDSPASDLDLMDGNGNVLVRFANGNIETSNFDSSEAVTSSSVTNIVSLTQAQYDALATKDSNTLYVII